MRQRKIYLASSWRNEMQPQMVRLLRSVGHDTYDFRHPAPGNFGFHWSEVDCGWQQWTTQGYIEGLNHPVAVEGFANDFHAMSWADTCVLLLPCGRSAHIEAGWMKGAGKDLFIVLDPDEVVPELMYKMADGIFADLNELTERLAR